MDKNEVAQQLNREFLELIDENAPRHTFDLSPLISYHLGNCFINPHFYHLNPEYCANVDESISQKSLSPFYYYLLGIIQYYRGRQFYTAAVQNLHHALEHWNKSELNKSVEAGHAYYLLSKIQQEMGYFVESISLSEKANVILCNVVEMDISFENHPVSAKKVRTI
jgi:tetratricopeptide (TPR) repeat protein